MARTERQPDLESFQERRAGAMLRKRVAVQKLLENSYQLHYADVEKILDSFFAPDFLPNWYFHSNSAMEISHHIFIITQLLNARTDYLRQLSADGNAITYFINVGRDFAGKMLVLVEENLNMHITSFDTVKTRSGIRIVTMERRGRIRFELSEGERLEIAKVLDEVRNNASKQGLEHTEEFIQSLPPNYMNEEINALTFPRRILRHLDLYEAAIESPTYVVRLQNTEWEMDDENEKLQRHEQRLAVACKDPDETFVPTVLRMLKDARINMNRSYFDTFESESAPHAVATISIYLHPDIEVTEITERLQKQPCGTPRNTPVRSATDELIEHMRAVSDKSLDTASIGQHLSAIRTLASRYRESEQHHACPGYLVDAIAGFFEAAESIDIASNDEVLRALLTFEAFDEFWVETTRDKSRVNSHGYRIKHSSARGPHHGGVRISPSVDLGDMLATAITMTWKSSRMRIPFGGSIGGLSIDPRAYRNDSLELADTLANFGRELFLVTGPALDVATGDIGCGPHEIGVMFEGFKSALRDLAMMVYGLKRGVAFIGDSVISMERAREMLNEFFAVDHHDRRILRELCTNERYLELVAATQITGKPTMGIAAHDGAMGIGLAYAILATVSRIQLSDSWRGDLELSTIDREALEAFCALDIATHTGPTVEQWGLLERRIWPRLLAGSRVAVQGFGRIAQSVLEHLLPFGINIVSASDRTGAVSGEALDLEELVAVKRKTGSVLFVETGVSEKEEGSEALLKSVESECDILVPAAIDGAIDETGASRVKARIVASASNGATTNAAERILEERGISLIHDLVANSGGLIASYFEWLRNTTDRRRYEAVEIRNERFDIAELESALMPECRERLIDILKARESVEATTKWNAILRDVIVSRLNEDARMRESIERGTRATILSDSIARELAAMLGTSAPAAEHPIWETLSAEAKRHLSPYVKGAAGANGSI